MLISIITVTIVILTVAIIITTGVAMSAAVPTAIEIRITMSASTQITHIIALTVFILWVVLLIPSL